MEDRTGDAEFKQVVEAARRVKQWWDKGEQLPEAKQPPAMQSDKKAA